MNIYIVDNCHGKFSGVLKDAWIKAGHEVTLFHCFHLPYYEKADVVYFDFVDSNAQWYSTYLDKPSNKTIVARCVDIDAYQGHPGAVDWKKFDGLIFIAKHIQEYCNKTCPVVADVKQYLVRCGVDTSKFSMSPRMAHSELQDTTRYPELNIAWVGRLWIGKNFAGVLDICYLLKKRGINFKLNVRADTADPRWWEEYYEYKIRDMGLENNIVYHDYVEDMNLWLDGMDFAVVSSFKEAFSYATAEAASKGIQPLIHNCMGMRDIWPEKWIYNTPDEAVELILNGDGMKPEERRDYVISNFSDKTHILETSRICGITL